MLSLTAIYPWMLGTFRTLDVGHLIGQNGPGFHLFVGTVAFGLALWGGLHRNALADPVRRCALGLVVAYLFIQSTGLRDVLYARSAGLAEIGRAHV